MVALEPPTQTEEGAAAVESLMGIRSGHSLLLDVAAGPEGSLPSGGLREILGLMSCDAAAAADGGVPGGLGMFLASRWVRGRVE